MPRAGLSTDLVVEEAATLADEVGYDGLTLTELADRLGVAVPSLYKHVGGLDALRLGVAMLALDELGQAMREAVSFADDDPATSPFKAVATSFRRYAQAHPGRYAATVRAARPDQHDLTAAGEDALQTSFSVLAETGLRGDDLIHAARATRASLHGFVALEAAHGFGLPQDVERSFEYLVQALELGFQASERP